jgi:hypothetical protein
MSPSLRNPRPSYPPAQHSSTSTAPESAESLFIFTCFPNLTRELRSQIWKYACFEAREIHFCAKPDTRSYEYNKRNYHDDIRSYNVKNQRRIPAVLEVCSEAREEGQRYYTRCLRRALDTRRFIPAADHHPPPQNQKKSSVVYVNFAVDIFKSQPVLLSSGLAQILSYDGSGSGSSSSSEFSADTVAKIQQVVIESEFFISGDLASIAHNLPDPNTDPERISLRFRSTWSDLRDLTFNVPLAVPPADAQGEYGNHDIWRAQKEHEIRDRITQKMGKKWQKVTDLICVNILLT